MNLFRPLPPSDEHDPFAPPAAGAEDWRQHGWHPVDAPGETGDAPDDTSPPRRRIGVLRWIARGLAVLIVLFVVAIGWLAITAPLSRSLKPPTPPSITLAADDGTPIARRGAIIGAPVSVKALPAHVPQAFLAIEDRRFYRHGAIDPRGIARAMVHNLRSHGVREGGSTITQQLAKNAFLDNDRTAARKLREVTIAYWLEAWLSKDEILSRYLSNVYFGDNVYGLTAAARHYFGVAPDDLSVGQAAMLAGLVKAPSRLAPTGNPAGAAARMRVVLHAMVEAGYLSAARAGDVATPRIRANGPATLPNGTYFADWVLPAAREHAAGDGGGSGAGAIRDEATVRTTLDPRLQRAAEAAIRGAGLARAQAALVAMRPDGRVVAMVGGRDYADSPFNRATQARRQPGSTFKLFVYLAALRSGLTPDSIVEDKPVDIAGWRPRNADGRYQGPITLRQAFAKSSNVAAARLTQKVGVRNVIKAARDLGVSTPLADEATIALGTQTMSLLELTAAYAAVADGRYPVGARGLDEAPAEKGWLPSLTGGQTTMPEGVHAQMLDLLHASISQGTGRQANLPIEAWGKTGTTQDSRDALFIGFARDLVVGVWVGDDDNKPNPGLSGGGVPARLWRGFMMRALNLHVAPAPVFVPDDAVDPDALPGNATDGDIEAEVRDRVGEAIGRGTAGLRGRLNGMGLDLHVGRDGSISLDRSGPRDRPPPRREDRRAREEDDDDE